MNVGQFYFISDEFYVIHDSENQLMKNREAGHNRPCFFAFPDKQEPDIHWCVPISSKIQKYESIVAGKIDRQIQRGIKKPKCNTILFGDVLGCKRAFLIQNMFPVIDEYIVSTYIDKATNKPVTISTQTEKEIMRNANDILKLVQRGNTHLVFSPILATRENLIDELSQRITLSLH